MRRRVKPGEKILRPLRPSAGLAAIYRKKLYALIDDLTTSVEHWITAAYRKAKPALAQDEATIPRLHASYVGGTRPWLAMVNGEPLRTSRGATIKFATEANAIRAARVAVGELLPADELQAAMSDLGDYWLARFDEASNRLAEFFSKAAAQRTDAQLKSILRDGGFSVKFNPTPAQLDILRASVHENVSLIKSIPQQYLKSVEGAVMRSVQRGRDIGGLAKELEHAYGVTKRRAAFISIDQNNKNTAAFHRARQVELGLYTSIWLHSGAGRHPRPTHVAMSGKQFDVRDGMYDSAVGKKVLPGELPRCRCVMKTVIPGIQ